MVDPLLIFSVLLIIFFVILCIGVGIYSLRTRQKLSTATIPWHQQSTLLFGLNSLLFALMVCLGVLWEFIPSRMWQGILLAVIILMGIVSLFILVRAVMVSRPVPKKTGDQ